MTHAAIEHMAREVYDLLEPNDKDKFTEAFKRFVFTEIVGRLPDEENDALLVIAKAMVNKRGGP